MRQKGELWPRGSEFSGSIQRNPTKIAAQLGIGVASVYRISKARKPARDPGAGQMSPFD